jgi:hypothetical protein
VAQIKWNFEVFKWSIPQLIGISYCIFMDFHTPNFLNIPSGETLLAFIVDVEHHYLDNPYHSFLHAVDVLEFMYYLLVDFDVSKYLEAKDVILCLLSSLCHDLGHPGLNNAFQTNANTLLAQQYTGTSILESYSVDLTHKLLHKHELLKPM